MVIDLNIENESIKILRLINFMSIYTCILVFISIIFIGILYDVIYIPIPIGIYIYEMGKNKIITFPVFIN